MRMSRLILAAVLLLGGLVWIGQGTGMIPVGAMNGVSFWAAAGIVLVALAVVVLVRERRAQARVRDRP